MILGEGTYLAKILAAKRTEIAHLGMPSDRELDDLLQMLPRPLDLASSLRDRHDVRAIAEFKRASPSEGTIRDDADARAIAAAYVENGAAAISVLTDRHFEGDLEDLRVVRRTVSVPVLRKDFILEPAQIVEARRAGADAVLLIVAALDPPKLRSLVEFAHDLGLSVLCEAHEEHEVDRALAAGAKIIGVNARDLRTFEVDLGRVVAMRRLVPRSFTFVAESGIRSRDDVKRLRAAEVDAILVGTRLMRAADPGAELRELLRVGP